MRKAEVKRMKERASKSRGDKMFRREMKFWPIK